jgi:hypothetical protein
MTPILRVLLLLSQAERAVSPATGARQSPLAASSAGGWHYLTRLEATGLALLPSGEVDSLESHAQLTLYGLAEAGTLLYPAADGPLRPGAYASLGQGVDHAR